MEHHHTATQLQGEGVWHNLRQFFSEADFMPHGHCYLWKPALVWSHVISDLLIGAAYFGISITLYALVKKTKIPFHLMVICFGIFIGACGLTHILEAWNLWHADYWLSAWVKIITAIASVLTCVYLVRLRSPILTVVEASKLAEERRLDLEALTRDLEQRVKERTKELTEAVAARDQFLSIASHELKTPLTAMKLQAQMKRRKLRDGEPGLSLEESEKLLKAVDDQVGRLSSLVDDMLDVSRIQNGTFSLNPALHDLSKIVDGIIYNFRHLFELSGAQLHWNKPESAIAKVDKHRIEQVIDNLLTNALKYAPGATVHVELIDQADKITIRVQDEGPGIDPQVKDKIFERFERGDTPDGVSGFGLGLFISRKIAEIHHGSIWVDTKVETGAAFIFEIPKSI